MIFVEVFIGISRNFVVMFVIFVNIYYLNLVTIGWLRKILIGEISLSRREIAL
jgi:hypothetical protein